MFDGKTLNLENIHSFPFSKGIVNTSLGRILLQNKDDLIFAIGSTMNLPGFCDQQNHHPLEYCYFIGKPGSSEFLSAPVRGNFAVPKEIIHLLHNSKVNPDLVEAREKLLEELESPRIYEGISPPPYIAHAGGGINGETYTNSLEALNLNYDLGHRFFEIDFSWTRDSQLVAIHDWNESLERRFHQTDKPGTQTKDDFLKLKPKNGLTQLTLPDVLEWANQKGDAYIITDIKNRNVAALKKIRREYGELSRHIIPQVYNYTEYYETKAIGYENVILTLYQMQINLKELIDFVAAEEPFAVTMHYSLAQDGLAQMLTPWKIFSYAHTVNDPKIHSELIENGVGGIYTDFLTPPQ